MTNTGRDLHAHVEALFPLLRSITGEGVRRTLRYVADRLPAWFKAGLQLEPG